MRSCRVVFAAGLALASLPALAQQPSMKDIYKGKVKPGMYETRVVTDMSGLPGVPKEQAKTTETHKRCMTPQEVETGLKTRGDCKVKTFDQSPTEARFVSECKDGTVNELRVNFTAAGFSSEMKTTGKQDGKSYAMAMKTESKYLGPCKS